MIQCLFCPAVYKRASELREHSAVCEKHPLMLRIKSILDIYMKVKYGGDSLDNYDISFDHIAKKVK